MRGLLSPAIGVFCLYHAVRHGFIERRFGFRSDGAARVVEGALALYYGLCLVTLSALAFWLAYRFWIRDNTIGS